ncbi:hypothetical protein GCM10027075_25330 [Streptomyces heilongjiangensis]
MRRPGGEGRPLAEVPAAAALRAAAAYGVPGRAGGPSLSGPGPTCESGLKAGVIYIYAGQEPPMYK